MELEDKLKAVFDGLGPNQFLLVRQDLCIPAQGFELNKWRTAYRKIVEISDYHDEPVGWTEEGEAVAIWATEESEWMIAETIS